MKYNTGVLIMKFKSALLVCLLLLSLCSSTEVFAVGCSNPSMKTVLMKNINWHSMMPMYFAGSVSAVAEDGVIDINDTIGANSAVCSCGASAIKRYGIPIGFWEPARIVERVHDAFCLYAFNSDVSGSMDWREKGTTKLPNSVLPGAESAFNHAHYYMFPVMAILGIAIDISCAEASGVDIGYMTEVDPAWRKDSLSTILQPEALLFANPFSQLACMPSTITDQLGMALPGRYFFWCNGAKGSVYPITGNNSHDHVTDEVGGTVNKLIFKLTRQAMIWDPAVHVCYPLPTLTWIKDHYKMHVSEAFRSPITSTLGTSSLINGFYQNVPFYENYVHVIFRKRMCCMF
jgi:conjugal transfer pilus assembly protein TraU